MTSGIYCIENMINGKKYIGKAKKIERRMWQNHEGCTLIERAIKKYGDKLIRYIIEYCEYDKLIEKERYYILNWNTKAPNGYNLTDGGDGMLNPPYWVRERLSESKKGIKNPNYGKFGKDNPKYGVTVSEKSRKLMSDGHLQYKGPKNHNYGKKIKKPTSSKYFGVYRNIIKKIYLRWDVIINEQGKRIFLGRFKNECDAAKTYDKYVIENNLPRPLNFPEDYPNRKEGQ